MVDFIERFKQGIQEARTGYIPPNSNRKKKRGTKPEEATPQEVTPQEEIPQEIDPQEAQPQEAQPQEAMPLDTPSQESQLQEQEEKNPNHLDLLSFKNRYAQMQNAYLNDREIVEAMRSSQYGERIDTAKQEGFSNKEIIDLFLDESKEKIREKTELFENPVANFVARKGLQPVLSALDGQYLRIFWPLEVAVQGKRGLDYLNKGPFEKLRQTKTVKFLEKISDPFGVGKKLEKKVEPLRSAGQSFLREKLGLGKYIDFIKSDDPIPTTLPSHWIRKGVEHYTGKDISPQDITEHALDFYGLVNPSGAQKIVKAVTSKKVAKEIYKALAPKKMVSSVAVGMAMQKSAEEEWGPWGTMAMMAVADLGTRGALSAPGAILKIGKSISSKRALAKLVAKTVSKNSLELKQELIKKFEAAGITPDVGTVTGNRMVQAFQSILAQSSLSGKALEEFSLKIKNQFLSQYENIANSLGEGIYNSKFEAGTLLKETLKKSEELDKTFHSAFYEEAKTVAKNSVVDAESIWKEATRLEKELSQGSVKSADQKLVLKRLKEIKKDINPETFEAKASSLIGSKRGIQDVINFEVQGTPRKLLNNIVDRIDHSIIKGKNKRLGKVYAKANQRFKEHIGIFREKPIKYIFSNKNPEKILDTMSDAHNIRKIREALSLTKEGKKIFDKLAKFKMEEMIGQGMVNELTQQLNYGKFGNSILKNKNKAILKELLPEKTFSRLERLAELSNELANTRNKFLNASQSGRYLGDIALVTNIFYGIGSLFTLNPFPLASSLGIVGGGRRLARLLADEEFLKSFNEAIISRSKNPAVLQRQSRKIINAVNKVDPKLIAILSRGQRKKREEEERASKPR